MKIVIDAFGGDNCPDAVVGGSITAVNLLENVSIILVGDETKIKKCIAHFGYNGNSIEIVHAGEVISCDEAPTSAIKRKDTSMVKAIEVLNTRDDVEGLISTGSTGALLTGAVLKVGRVPGVLRPALAPIFVNSNGTRTLLCDSGSNVDCKPEYLYQFAKMGIEYYRGVEKCASPRVALLNVGTEDTKGNELTKQAFDIIKKDNTINFVGNIEARELFDDRADVIVADGFVGNIALKSVEGTALYILESMKKNIKNGGLRAKLGYILLKKALKKSVASLDYTTNGGAPFLGVKKPVLKVHGSCTAETIYTAIIQMKSITKFGLSQKIEESLKED